MRYTTKTEYGVMCLMHVAKAHGGRVTSRDLTSEEGYPVAYIEKILRALRKADIITSFQGNQGGYILARAASEITLRDIIVALEGETFDVFCNINDNDEKEKEIVCNHHLACSLMPVWQKTKALLDQFFDAITLEMMANGEIPDLSFKKWQFSPSVELPTFPANDLNIDYGE